ncbi:MAG: 50S ribosomal protein L29 [Actinomycetota bacterium]
MPKSRTKELRDMGHGDLEQRMAETKEELFNLRFQNATGQLDNYKRLNVLRKDIARIKTLLREQEINEDEGQAK